jgi:hypothetical protein
MYTFVIQVGQGGRNTVGTPPLGLRQGKHYFEFQIGAAFQCMVADCWCRDSGGMHDCVYRSYWSHFLSRKSLTASQEWNEREIEGAWKCESGQQTCLFTRSYQGLTDSLGQSLAHTAPPLSIVHPQDQKLVIFRRRGWKGGWPLFRDLKVI